MNDDQLIARAQQAAGNAYVPYSGHATGAALLTSDGEVFSGAGMECASFGGTVCAEAAALTAAVTAGKREFSRLALVPERWPCGSCRQRLREFGLNLQVVTPQAGGSVRRLTLSELLPDSFGPANLS